jgi:hypothetical protein
MDTSKINKWFKVAVDDAASDDWMVALFGRDKDGHDYAVVTNGIQGSQMAGNPDVFLGARGDAELAVRLLNRYHSSRKNHPAMTDEMNAVADAYNNHLQHHPNADFEVCDDPRCRLAVLLKQAYGWTNEDARDEDGN